MKAKSILVALLLMIAGLQSVWAQKIILHMPNNQKAEYEISQLDSITFEQGHEWVDLGLPSGTLWATCNIGANSPEEYGDYFAWGETMVKADYSWSTYKYCDVSAGVLTKYNTQSDYGSVDGKTELEPEDDAATANWGSEWQMPNKAQWEELLNKDHITKTRTTLNNVNGYLFTSKSNGNSIFIPAAGARVGTSSSNVGSDAYCWSSSLQTDQSFYAYYYCDSYMLTNPRNCGLTVRPVRVQNTQPEIVKRVVLLEDFTGQRCTNCPKANDVIEQLQEAYGEALVAVGLHGGPLSFAGSAKAVGLKTATADEYYNHWNLEYQPIGLVNRQAPVNYPEWDADVRMELTKPALLRLEGTAVLADNIVTIQVNAAGTVGTVTGKLQVWLIEDNIKALQLMPDGTANQEYIHNHVFRTAVNGTWGEDIRIEEGETEHRTMTLPLEQDWNPNELSIVAFVYNDNGVQQATKIKVE